MRKLTLGAVAMLGLAMALHPASAQEYPSRPVRVVIPFAAGAGTDLTGRIVAQELSKRLGQQFFVENKPGAAAQLGTDLVAKSPPDGYTLLLDGHRRAVRSAGRQSLRALRGAGRFRIHRQHRPAAVHPDGPSEMAFQIGRRVRRLRQGQSQQAELRQRRRRQCSAHEYGADRGKGRHPDGSAFTVAGLGPATNALLAGTVDVARDNCRPRSSRTSIPGRCGRWA